MSENEQVDINTYIYSKALGHSLIIAGKSLPTLAIIAYFSGWQYVNEYFSTFGINRSTYSFTDYTTFLYSFSVITKIPSIIWGLNLKSLIGIVAALMFVSGPLLIRHLKVSLRRMHLLRFWSWFWIILAFFFISQEAGKIEAKKVLSKEGRQVKVLFNKSFKDNLIAIEGKNNGEQQFKELTEASHLGAFALIRRTANETILLQFGTVGDHHEVPLDILRVANSHIVSIIYKIPKS